MLTVQEWLDSLGALDLVTLFGWAATVIIFVVKVWPAVKAMRSISERVHNMLDDWFGEEGRPGVEERPGVMVRLERLEKAAQKSAYDSGPNNGHSAWDAQMKEMRDGFARIEARLEGKSDG